VPCRQLVDEDRALDRIGPLVDAAHVGGDVVIFNGAATTARRALRRQFAPPRLFARWMLRCGLSRTPQRRGKVVDFFAERWICETRNGLRLCRNGQRTPPQLVSLFGIGVPSLAPRRPPRAAIAQIEGKWNREAAIICTASKPWPPAAG
jgi:hypothetical protein